MATIKAIERRSVHQIQSGQVIVDLVSVVKELVENSLDAGASSIDIRFKNHGLDAIEVQDNGTGIAPQDFETLALKHYTSKLTSFEDLDSLDTFGFRGEALSSLSALSTLQVITAREQDGAVGRSLQFEQSGKLKNTSVVAAQKGTTVVVETLFHNLPVRRKELEKNIKREYGKVLGFLHSYACIGVGLRISVSNQMPKGKKMTAFSTKGNATTKENIANVYGAKTLSALIKVDLNLSMQPGNTPTTQTAKDWPNQATDQQRLVRVEGHISKPGWGEGRQAPDRQMLFVNSRPCNLPQVSKVFNEVYRSFNHHQSPFILANLRMDTHLYDVNVSPDKKTIMLHDQTALLEALKSGLIALFENIDHTLPQTQPLAPKLPSFMPLSITRQSSTTELSDHRSLRGAGNLNESWTIRDSTQQRPPADERNEPDVCRPGPKVTSTRSLFDAEIHSGQSSRGNARTRISAEIVGSDADDDARTPSSDRHNQVEEDGLHHKLDDSVPIADCADQPREQDVAIVEEVHRSSDDGEHEQDDAGDFAGTPRSHTPRQTQIEIPSIATGTPTLDTGPVPDAFARMRARKASSESIEIIIGDSSTDRPSTKDLWNKRRKLNIIRRPATTGIEVSAAGSLSHFAAPGSQLSLNFADRSNPGHDIDGSVLASGDSTPEFPPTQSASGSPELAILSGDEAQSTSDASTDDSVAVPVDSDNLDEASQKQHEDEKVARLILDAEHAILKGASRRNRNLTMQSNKARKDATHNLSAWMKTSMDQIRDMMEKLAKLLDNAASSRSDASSESDTADIDAESKLSLTVRKADFERMNVVGQFNLGFILATRPSLAENEQDELFIIDQHAADEKYNYERLQSSVVLQCQRLVRPINLELSAVEQEVVLNHTEALKANGFEVATTCDGETGPDIQTFKLLTLPMTNHKTFHQSDLEELLHLLSEIPSGSSEIPRPRKVQRILAMRACRSSIMVGKTLTTKQMSTVVRHMGGMDKPWNCPHGRPTMRHLYGLGRWNGWHEWQYRHDGMTGGNTSSEDITALKEWMQQEAETTVS